MEACAPVRRAIAILLSTLAAACASEVVRQPATLTPAAAGAERRELQMAQDSEVSVSATYSRVLPAGSRWQFVGELPQGAVYRRVDGIFTVEGAHVHEAYLVIAGEKLVGFYLPVESSFAPTTPIVLKTR